MDAAPVRRRRLNLKFAASLYEADTRWIVVVVFENRDGRCEVSGGVRCERFFIRAKALME